MRRLCAISGRRWFVAALFLAGFAVVFALLALMGARSLTPREVDLSQVTRLSGIQFPPGALLTGGAFIEYLRPHLIARVSMGRGELDGFLAASDLVFSNSARDRDEVLRKLGMGRAIGADWWTPRAPQEFLSAYREERVGGGSSTVRKRLAILVDLDDPKLAVVYLQSFTDA